MKYTEKRNGRNVIPLRNVICGVDMPHWSIIKVSDVEMYLTGDAVDKLAALENQEPVVKPGDIVCMTYTYKDKEIIGKFKVAAILMDSIRLDAVFTWDEAQIEEETGVKYLDVPMNQWQSRTRSIKQWVECLNKLRKGGLENV